MQQNLEFDGELPRAAATARWGSTAPWLAALVVALGLHVWFPRVDVDPQNDTYSAEVGGRNAFFQLTARRMPDVSRNLEPLYRAAESLDTGTTLCILGPARSPSSREWENVLDWVARGGRLVYAPRMEQPALDLPAVGARIEDPRQTKAAAAAQSVVKSPPAGASSGEQKKTGDASAAQPGPAETPPANGDPPADAVSQPAVDGAASPSASDSGDVLVAAWLLDPSADSGLVPGREILWRSRGSIAAAGSETLVRAGGREQAVRIRHGGGTLVLCASDQVFSNVSVFDREHENGYLATRLVDAAGERRPVVFDESLNATGAPRVVGLLLDPHLRPLTVQLLAVLVLFGWRGGRRFGPVLPRAAGERHNLADHTDALGNLYYKTRYSAGALRSYLEQLRRQLRLSPAAARDERALAPLAQRCGLKADEIGRLLALSENAAKNDRLPRRDAALLIRRLSALRRRRA